MSKGLAASARLNAIRLRSRHQIGKGAWIDPRAHLRNSPATIGARSRIFRGTEMDAGVTIGEDTFVNRDCYIRAGTTIGSRVDIGPFTRLITETHDLGSCTRRAGATHRHPISIGNGAWLGAGVTVLPGVQIGSGAVVAAGSVVRHDVAPNTLVAGIPAKHVRDLPV